MIFVSYASEDRSRAARVVEAIQAHGQTDVWFAPRDVGSTDPYVREIEEALGRADIVLVLWSRHAAASTWVQTERDSSLARSHNGERVRVVMARLDDTHPPPLSAAELCLDFRAEETLPETVAEFLKVEPTSNDDEFRERIVQTELPRAEQIAEVVRYLGRSEPVVVLASRKGGSHSFTRQLQARLAAEQPDWTVVAVPVRPLPLEDLHSYLARMRGLMQLDESEGGRLVICAHGWSQGAAGDEGKSSEFQEALANVLRTCAEGGGTPQRPCSLVATGSYSLFLLRYTGESRSVFKNAMQVDLPDLTCDEVEAWMAKVEPGSWTEHAGEVWRRTGGHPYLTKKLVHAWATDASGGWDAAEENLLEDTNFLLPLFTNAIQHPQHGEEAKNELRRCLESRNGLRYTVVNPRAMSLRLLYEGLLRRDGRRLKLRCRAIETLFKDIAEEA